MAPAKPRGGVMTARSSSAADSCHVFGPSCVPADNADPAASPLITTAAFGPTSLVETVKLVASSVRSGRTAPTVSCWDGVRGDAVSRDFCSLDGRAIAFVAAGNANVGSADWGAEATDRSDANLC